MEHRCTHKASQGDAPPTAQDSTGGALSTGPAGAAINSCPAEPTVARGITFNLDGSLSMTGLSATDAHILGKQSKTEAVALAVAGTISRLRNSQISSHFHVGYIAFSDRVTVDRAIRPIDHLDPTEELDPTQAGSQGTRIGEGLVAAGAQIERWRSVQPSGNTVSNVVLVVGDGLCAEPTQTLETADHLKSLPGVVVAACLLGGHHAPPGAAELLRRVASGPRFYGQVSDAASLEGFLLWSIVRAVRL